MTMGFDPVMTGFEQPITMSPAGQRAAFGLPPVAPYRPGAPTGTGLGAGAGVVGFGASPPPAQPPVLGAIAPALGALGVAMPAWLLAILGVAGAGYAGYQALGGGEGGGLFGLNVLGGDEFAMGGLEFGGPGLPEPTQPYTEWHVGNKQFYYVKQYTTTGKFKHGKVAMYNRDTKQWKVWTLPKPNLAIIGKNHPSHRMLTRLRRNMKRHTADAKTILKITSPGSLESTRRAGGKWVHGKKRYID